MAGLSLNLIEQLAFYGAFHTNRWNKLIHFVFVPAILWSALVWGAAVAPLAALPPGTLPEWVPPEIASAFVLNAPAIVVALYSIFYIGLEFAAGLSWAVCVGVPLWLSATAFASQVPNAAAWALGVHVLSWYMQIHPGHVILEGRKPALLDSLVQALSLAPLFVWFELLFFLGYRPQLHKQLQARISQDVDAWRKAKLGTKAH